jgi:hypothetical protein
MKNQAVSPVMLRELYEDVFEVKNPCKLTEQEMVNLLNIEFRRLYRELDTARAGLRHKSRENLVLAEKVSRLC